MDRHIQKSFSCRQVRMRQEEDSHLAGKLPAVKNADHCFTWEEFPSPLQARKPGNEWEAAGVGQGEGTAQREQERARQWPDPREPSRGQQGQLL